MMRRLLDRNIATMVAVVLLGQVMAGVMLQVLVLRPQSERIADVTAEMTETIGRFMARMTMEERHQLVAHFNQDDAVVILPGNAPPKKGHRRPTLIERDFLRAIAHRLNHDQPVEFRADTDDRLWVRLWLGGEDWWVSLTPRRLRAPLMSVLIAMGTALIAAIAGGIALQRHVDRPLRNLVSSVDAYGPDRLSHAPMSENGPEEIAAVARAFNRLTERIAGHEAERALMLGAVSHDLRTPLTRLRLLLDMMRGADPDLMTRAAQQVDRIEDMLAQFLDLARGFEKEALEQVDLAALLVGAAMDAGFDPAHDEVTMDITVDVAPLRPIAMSRAITNLLSNARRHGAPPYTISAKRDGGDLVISIGDTGPGFDPARAQELSRPFARGDLARGGDHAGLGLAIVSRVMAAHHGSLHFMRDGPQFIAQLRLPL